MLSSPKAVNMIPDAQLVYIHVVYDALQIFTVDNMCIWRCIICEYCPNCLCVLVAYIVAFC